MAARNRSRSKPECGQPQRRPRFPPGVNGFPAGTYSPALGNYPGWVSDSVSPSHSAGQVTYTNVTIVVTDNGNGTSNEHIVAYYSGF